MSIDIHLFCISAGNSLWKAIRSVSHLIRIDVRFVFIEYFKLLDQSIESFGIVFGNIKLNAGSVEGKDVREGEIDQVADWFGEIDQLVEHLLDIRFKGGPEAGKKRGIGNFGEAAKSRNSLQRPRKRMSRESAGMEKIF